MATQNPPENTPSARPNHVSHLHGATSEAVLLQEINAPFTPVVLVDDSEGEEATIPGNESMDGGVNWQDVAGGPTEKFDVPEGVGKDIVVLHTPEIPDGGLAAWMVVAASAACNFICFGIQQSFGVFIGFYLNYTFAGKASAAMVSLTSSLQGGFSFLLGPLVGRVTDRFGARITCGIGAVLQIAANVGASFCTTTLPGIWVTQGILFGIGTCFVSNAAMSAPAQWFTKKLPLAYGISTAMGGAGGLTFTFATQAMLQNLGPEWTLRIYAIINAALVIPAAFALKTRAAVADPDAPKRPFVNFKLFGDLKFAIMCLGILFASFAFPAPFYLPAYTYTAGLNPSLGAPLLGVMAGLSGISPMIAGLIIPKVGMMNVFVISQLMAALSPFMFWLPAGTNVALLFVYAAVWGLTWGTVWSLLGQVSAVLFSHLDAFPVVIGSLYMVMSASMFANAPVFGLVVDAGATYGPDGSMISANYTWAIIWAGGVYLLGTAMFGLLRMMEAKWKLVAKV